MKNSNGILLALGAVVVAMGMGRVEPAPDPVDHGHIPEHPRSDLDVDVDGQYPDSPGWRLPDREDEKIAL